VIFINQIRMKIGVMFGNPETTTGGNALKFYASVRLDIRRIGAIKKGDEVIGNETRVKVVKNKVSPPFRRPSSTSCTAKGISREGEIIEMGVRAQVHRQVRRLVQPTTARKSARARTMSANGCVKTPPLPRKSKRRTRTPQAPVRRAVCRGLGQQQGQPAWCPAPAP
jgi:hypothetical protein